MGHFELYITLILIVHDITFFIQYEDGHVDLLPRRKFEVLTRCLTCFQLIHVHRALHIEWMNGRVLLVDIEELCCSIFSINAIFNPDGDWVRRDGFVLD